MPPNEAEQEQGTQSSDTTSQSPDYGMTHALLSLSRTSLISPFLVRKRLQASQNNPHF